MLRSRGRTFMTNYPLVGLVIFNRSVKTKTNHSNFENSCTPYVINKKKNSHTMVYRINNLNQY